MAKITQTKLGRMRKLDKTKAIFWRSRILKKRVPTNVAFYEKPEGHKEKVVEVPGYFKRLQIFVSGGEVYNARRRYRKEMERRAKFGGLFIGKK